MVCLGAKAPSVDRWIQAKGLTQVAVHKGVPMGSGC